MFAVVSGAAIGGIGVLMVALVKGYIALYYFLPLSFVFACIVPITLFDLHMEMSLGFG